MTVVSPHDSFSKCVGAFLFAREKAKTDCVPRINKGREIGCLDINRKCSTLFRKLFEAQPWHLCMTSEMIHQHRLHLPHGCNVMRCA